MSLRQGFANRDPHGPDIPRAEPAVIDPACVVAAGEPRSLARAGQFQGRAHLLTHRPARLVPDLRPERQIFHVLLAATIGLETDRGDRLGVRSHTSGWIKE